MSKMIEVGTLPPGTRFEFHGQSGEVIEHTPSATTVKYGIRPERRFRSKGRFAVIPAAPRRVRWAAGTMVCPTGDDS